MKRRFSFLVPFAVASALLFACSSSDTGAPSAKPGTGAPIAADQVGSACSGVGTSPGDTALFQQADCPAGLCVADARTDFSTYCTADCEARSCPGGYTCEAVTFGDAKYACLKSAAGSGSGTDPEPDASTDAKSGRIGTKSEKGSSTVEVDTSDKGSYACGAVCSAAGGKCVEDSGSNGVGYVHRKYNDGSGTTSHRISSCSESEDYYSFNTTMTAMTCYCDDMKVPPTVRVTKSEGLVSCEAVCASWSLTCSTSRKSYSYASPKDEGSVRLACGDAPPAGTDHYVCACE